MTKYKLDQLFKSKLDQFEIEPSDAALEKFQNQINGKRKPKVWFYIAASVSLLFSLSIWLWIGRTQEIVQVAGTEDIPKKPDEVIVEKTIPNEEKVVSPITEPIPNDVPIEVESFPAEEVLQVAGEEVQEITTEPITELPQEVVLAEVVDTASTLPVDTLQLMELESEPLVAEVLEEEKVVIVRNSLPKVKITYISGRKKNQSQLAQSSIPADTTNIKDGPFNRILNSARNFANGSLIADLRDAKENFFNKNDD